MKEIIEDFVSQKVIAVAGVSRNSKKFGNYVFRELKKKGYKVYPVNPRMETYNGSECFAGLSGIPEKVDCVVAVVPKDKTLDIAGECANLNITRLWIQQGVETAEAIDFCKENNIKVVHNQCIMMFAGQVKSIHAFHKWILKILNKLPE